MEVEELFESNPELAKQRIKADITAGKIEQMYLILQ